jgi:heat shock protein HslJ/uncharacterized membrane protein
MHCGNLKRNRFTSSVSAASAAVLMAGCAPTEGPVAASGATVEDVFLMPFVARGNEPGWSLRLDESRLELTYNYGNDRIEAPMPSPEVRDDGVRFAAMSTPHLDVQIRRQLCRDTMSGMLFPYTVDLVLDGAPLRGCGGDPLQLIAGHMWTVVAIEGRAVDGDADASIVFDLDGRIAGSTGCNRFTGSYTLTGEGLTVGPLAATRMACPPPRMAVESEFLAFMERVQRFDIDEIGELTLLDAAGGRLMARSGPK